VIKLNNFENGEYEIAHKNLKNSENNLRMSTAELPFASTPLFQSGKCLTNLSATNRGALRGTGNCSVVRSRKEDVLSSVALLC
jgi:hypothetical protein